MTRRPLVVAALALAGCVAPGTDLEALPFLRADRTTPGVTRVDVPLLLFTYDHVDAAQVAPVASYVVPEGEPPPDEDLTWVRFPYPFGLWVNDGGRHSYSVTAFLAGEGVGNTPGPLGRGLSSDPEVRADVLASFASDPAAGGIGTLPFVFSDTFIDHGAIPDSQDGPDLDHDISFLPFFMWGGGTDDDEDYFALAPFGGVTGGILGKEEILWIGFPYPLYARAVDRRYVSHHVLWPLVNWLSPPEEEDRLASGWPADAPPQNEGFRILPFYGHYERRAQGGETTFDRTWVLWPFLTWSTEGMPYDEAPTETFLAFPWYGSIRGPYYDATTVLFPFFKYETDSSRDDHWELRAPFPFVQLAGDDAGRWKRDFWPFIGFKERPGYSRWFALWPILRREVMELPRASFDGFWAMPFFWSTRWVNHEQGTEETSTRVWPLLHHRRTPGGTVDTALLSPWWWDDDGFERTLGALLRLYRYHRDPDGGVEHQALLGLFSWRDLPAMPDADRPDYWRLSLLFGLFQLRSLGDETGLRLLWLPEIAWGDRTPSVEEAR